MSHEPPGVPIWLIAGLLGLGVVGRVLLGIQGIAQYFGPDELANCRLLFLGLFLIGFFALVIRIIDGAFREFMDALRDEVKTPMGWVSLAGLMALILLAKSDKAFEFIAKTVTPTAAGVASGQPEKHQEALLIGAAIVFIANLVAVVLLNRGRST